MDEGAQVELDQNRKPAIPLLMELGALDLGAEAFDPKTKIIILTEDKNIDAVKVLVSANGDAKNVAYLSYNGCGNLTGARQLARLLTDLRPELRIIIHRDRDFRTSNEKIERVQEIFTPLIDVEHSLVSIAHLQAVFADKLSCSKVQEIVSDVIAERRDEFTGLVRDARDVINNTLYASERLRKKAAWAAANMPAKAPPYSEFLPKSGKDALLASNVTEKPCCARFCIVFAEN